MAPTCELCHDAESKYRCPTCGLRYCALACYKPHKLQHEEQQIVTTVQPQEELPKPQKKIDRPGTKQRVAKQSFKDFEEDAEFKRLLTRYPSLQVQLQGIYALTLDPGPEEEKSWNRSQLPFLRPSFSSMRGSRGRGRFSQRGRGARRGYGHAFEPPEGRQSGRWTKEKGDQEALYVLRKGQEDEQREDLSDGLQEFIELVKMRFKEAEST